MSDITCPADEQTRLLRRLMAIEQIASDAVITVDSRFDVVAFNPAASELTGWPTTEAHGRPLDQVAPLFDVHQPMPWASVLNDGRPASRRAAWLGRREGRPLDIDYSFRSLGRGAGWVVALTPQTADDASAIALRESEDRFHTLADNISQLAWMADEKGWIFWYNRRWYEYTGTTLEQMQGWGWRSVHHPDHVDRVVASLQRSWDTGEAWEETFPLRSSHGEYRWFLSRALPIRDASGAVVRWFGTNTDITERRQAEEALREADRRKDEFLAMLAHELRNPLAPIGFGLELLARQEGTDTQQLELVRDQFNQLVRLVDDLLDVSRLVRGKIDLRPTPVDLNQLARRSLAVARVQTSARDQVLSAALPDEPIWTVADAVRLSQALGNLLSNASKYSDDGARIELSLAREQDTAVITVTDEGVGIDSELLPHIFDLFTQADRSIDRSQGGLGIGLTVVKRLVELHGGRVSASSLGLAGGAVFTIELPISAPPQTPDGPPPRPTHARPHAVRALVVDDNVGATFLLSQLLAKLGDVHVETAHDGAAAVSKALHMAPDLVVCDIGLPGMDGYEVARSLRAAPGCRGAYLVALTGYGQAGDLEKAAAAGFDRHLVKPASVDDLESILAAVRPAAR
ncbi:ATP-binding protein [Botrimarina sp.]|uniref:hybrid sensor histidine kinase/response regulator n=1 Tax=Botrimarina sp. TaxID=2795802 RepID=UPI0032EB446C